MRYIKQKISQGISILLAALFISALCVGNSYAEEVLTNWKINDISKPGIIAQQVVPEISGKDPDKWEFNFIPGAWFPTMSTNIEIGNHNLQSTIKPSEILDDIDMAFAGRFEARKKNWGLFTDYYHIKATDDFYTQRLKNRFEFKNTIVQFAGFHRWYSKDEKSTYDALIGLRYYSLRMELDMADPIPNFTRSPNWWDPIIGGRANIHLSDNLKLGLYGDVGGFGAGSKFTWRAAGNLDWKMSEGFSLMAGYNTMGYDYEKGSGFGKVKTDIRMYGPTLGLNFKF